jgi:hypothetical protein
VDFFWVFFGARILERERLTRVTTSDFISPLEKAMLSSNPAFTIAKTLILEVFFIVSRTSSLPSLYCPFGQNILSSHFHSVKARSTP